MRSRFQSGVAWLSLLGLGVSMTGCATIVNGRTQNIPVASTPSGATVKAGDIQTTTPGSLSLRRGSDQDLVFQKEGFPERPAKLESKTSWWLLGNVLFGGLIGLIVDLSVGSGSKLVPISVDMDMATGVVKEIKGKGDEKKMEERK